MRSLLIASALFMTTLAGLAPTASAGQDIDLCLEWDTGDDTCVLRGYDGWTCLATVERGDPYLGVVCVNTQPTPRYCTLKGMNGDTLCVIV